MSADLVFLSDGNGIMIKSLLATSPIVLAFVLLGSPAAASPKWVDIGKGQLPTFGAGELYIGGLLRNPSGIVTGQLHAVLDEDWQDPLQPAAFRDIYFRVMADCRNGTVAFHSTWPDGPDESGIDRSDLRPPSPGSVDEKLLKVSCGQAR